MKNHIIYHAFHHHIVNGVAIKTGVGIQYNGQDHYNVKENEPYGKLWLELMTNLFQRLGQQNVNIIEPKDTIKLLTGFPYLTKMAKKAFKVVLKCIEEKDGSVEFIERTLLKHCAYKKRTYHDEYIQLIFAMVSTLANKDCYLDIPDTVRTIECGKLWVAIQKQVDGTYVKPDKKLNVKCFSKQVQNAFL